MLWIDLPLIVRSNIHRDFPSVYDGARGFHFIEKTVESSRSNGKLLDAHWRALERQRQAL